MLFLNSDITRCAAVQQGVSGRVFCNFVISCNFQANVTAVMDANLMVVLSMETDVATVWLEKVVL